MARNEQSVSSSPRPFQVMVDSASREEPPTRYFGSLEAALEAAAMYEGRWQPFIWVTELVSDGPNIVYVKDGKQIA